MPQRPVEFIGMIGTSNASEIRAAPADARCRKNVVVRSFVFF